MPSTKKQTEAILALLPSTLHGNIAELGSGWGTLAVAIARHLPECRVKGYENSPVPVFTSRCLKKLASAANLEITRADFMQIDLSVFDAIVCYLHPAAMRKLEAKLEAEVRPGTPVISNTFAVMNWKAEQMTELDDLYHTKIYLYRKP